MVIAVEGYSYWPSHAGGGQLVEGALGAARKHLEVTAQENKGNDVAVVS